jgi:hypothetical protein
MKIHSAFLELLRVDVQTDRYGEATGRILLSNSPKNVF